MKLKTLKDLKHLVEREEGLPDYEAVDCLTLKQEAIKWVKDRVFENWMNFVDYETGSSRNVVNWIKHFFNITEEDLK